ncbi:MAG: vitamin K epoxide reductase family protein [Thermoanaerobaculia bacterium]
MDLTVHAPPFERNPSSWSQRLPIVALAFIAFLMSAYLALYQWRVIDSVWDPFFGDGSEIVLDSKASEDMRKVIKIPDGALGALGYLSEVIFGLAGSTRRWQYRPWLVLLFGFDVIPLGIVSVVLVFVQGLIVGSWCTICLATAAISIALVILAYDEVWASILYLRRVWKHARSPRVLWKVFWGGAAGAAAEVALRRN